MRPLWGRPLAQCFLPHLYPLGLVGVCLLSHHGYRKGSPGTGDKGEDFHPQDLTLNWGITWGRGTDAHSTHRTGIDKALPHLLAKGL